jgi:dTDP-4-amino-4,6-dideoxygalactose transaminase
MDMMRGVIPFNRPLITEHDQQILGEAINRGHSAGNGPFTKSFELALKARMGVSQVLLTTSCTHALEMSALLCNLKPGDEVIVPSFTFVSTASAFALFGAKPVFVDSTFETLNIDPNLIEASITPRTRAICVVHYGGVACDLDKILSIANKYGLIVIEDNAHGLLSKYFGKYTGSFGALATQSFHETKNITCGEGGALLVNDESLSERAQVLREKGTNRSLFLRGQVDKYTWVDIGSSWVLSDLLAALLVGQLERINEINQRRLEIWNRYHSELQQWAASRIILQPQIPAECEHVGHLYFLRFQNREQRTRFIEHMKEQSISCVFHYQALNTSPVGRSFGGHTGQCPNAEQASECLVRLPLFNSMSDDDQEKVIKTAVTFTP